MSCGCGSSRLFFFFFLVRRAHGNSYDDSSSVVKNLAGSFSIMHALQLREEDTWEDHLGELFLFSSCAVWPQHTPLLYVENFLCAVRGVPTLTTELSCSAERQDHKLHRIIQVDLMKSRLVTCNNSHRRRSKTHTLF